MNDKKNELRKELYKEPYKLTVVYAGSINKSRMFPEIADAVHELEDVSFLLAGNDMCNIAERVEEWDDVLYFGNLPLGMVRKMTLASDCLVCMFSPENKNCQVGLPNKLFEAMAWGRPIITTEGMYYSTFVESFNCGLTVPYRIDSVKDALMRLRDSPKLREELSLNGLKAAKSQFNWEEQEKKLMGAYEDL